RKLLECRRLEATTHAGLERQRLGGMKQHISPGADLRTELLMLIEATAQHQLPAFTQENFILRKEGIVRLAFFALTINGWVFQALAPEFAAERQLMNASQGKGDPVIEHGIGKPDRKSTR